MAFYALLPKKSGTLGNSIIGKYSMNIFDSLTKYAEKWQVKASRKFTADEIAAVESAVVVDSQYGNSVRFYMTGGGQTFIPLSNSSTKGIGEVVDLQSVTLLTLSKPGESDILRVEC